MQIQYETIQQYIYSLRTVKSNRKNLPELKKDKDTNHQIKFCNPPFQMPSLLETWCRCTVCSSEGIESRTFISWQTALLSSTSDSTHER